MEPRSPSVEPYLDRIGFEGRAAPDLETLTRLHALHTREIPFENLSAFLGEPIGLDPDALHDKLVARRRGGWCFEHNIYFTHMLRSIGFDVKTLAARVRWNVPPGVTTARSHMLMLIALEGRRFVADVGFGGLTLTSPLELVAGVEQPTPNEPHRFVTEADRFVLQAKIAGEWQSLYAFDLHEQLQADYEVSNWYLANFPQSQFVTGIVAARADVGERHALRNTRYAIHRAGGQTQRRFLGSVGEVKEVLRGPMRIPLPAHPGLDARIQRMIDANPPS
jgi:N-hydroxyarylamine O-acetyltransferase